MSSHRLRTLALFVVVGGALAALGRVFGGEPPELVVNVPAAASEAAIRAAVDDALLVELGLELGWRDDPLIVDSLARGLGFVGLQGEPAALVERAAALDLPRRDPLARARLAERARVLLTRVRPPTDAELEAYLAGPSADPHRFARPTILRLHHELVGDGPPELVLGPRPTRSTAQLERALGADAVAAIMALPVASGDVERAAWSEPIRSRMGLHRFKVEAKIPGAVPALEHIRAEVAGAWLDARRDEQLAAGLARLRAERTIRLEEIVP